MLKHSRNLGHYRLNVSAVQTIPAAAADAVPPSGRWLAAAAGWWAALLLASVSALPVSVPARADAAEVSTAVAARAPGAPRLLPEETFFYLRLDNASDFRDEFAASSLGQMLADPQLRPFVADSYSTLAEEFSAVGASLGVTLDELLAIPQGQVSLAVVPVSDEIPLASSDSSDRSEEAIRQRIADRQASSNRLGLFLLIETGDSDATLRGLVDRLMDNGETSEVVRRSDSIGGVAVHRLVESRTGRSRVEYFFRGQTLVLGLGHRVASDVLARWDGSGTGRTLAESSTFAATLGRCIGAVDTEPQLTMFIDPYRIGRWIASQAGAGGALVWPIFEELGAAKIQGIGASSFRGGEVFESITHMHIAIDPPRDGIFSLLRPQATEITPPAWVAGDVTGYWTLGWRAAPTYNGWGIILDRFRGEDSLRNGFEQRVQQRVGLDFRQQVIENLDDRAVLIRWLQPPGNFGDMTNAVGLLVKDRGVMQTTIEALEKAFPQRLRQDRLGTTTIYRLGSGSRDEASGGDAATDGGGPPRTARPRQPDPCLVLLGNWLVIADSSQLLENVIRADGGAIPQLAHHLDYEWVVSELGLQLGGQKPYSLSYTRVADELRQLYQLAKSDGVRQGLENAREGNRPAALLRGLLGRHQLPEFDELVKYFGPTGGFAYDEPGGVHLGWYSLKAAQ